MMQINQCGEPVTETVLYANDMDTESLREVVHLLLTKLNLQIVETNATKHGTIEIELRSQP